MHLVTPIVITVDETLKRHVAMALSSGPACRTSRRHRQGRAGHGAAHPS